MNAMFVVAFGVGNVVIVAPGGQHGPVLRQREIGKGAERRLLIWFDGEGRDVVAPDLVPRDARGRGAARSATIARRLAFAGTAG